MSTHKTPLVPAALFALSLFPTFITTTADAQCTYGWKPTGGHLPGVDGTVTAIAIYDDGTGPALYVGGSFTVAGNAIIRNIAKWNGTDWRPLGTSPIDGVDGGVSAMTVYNGELIVGGHFTSAGSISAARIARWNGTSWAPLDGGVNASGSAEVRALSVYNGQLIAAGYFSSAGSVNANNIAKWDGANWSALGGGVTGGSAHFPLVYALTVYNAELIVGGYFTTAGSTTVNHIARWNGSSWSALSTGVAMTSPYTPTVGALTVFNSQLIACGDFTSAGGVAASHVATWNGSAWSPLGSGIGKGSYGPLSALTVYDGQLIVGGSFTQAGGASAASIAAWNGASWSTLDAGPNNGVSWGVFALTVFNHQLIVGGSFYRAGTTSASSVATWNGATWSPLDDQPSGELFGDILTLTSFDGDLIAGGAFNIAGSSGLQNVAKWNGTTWSPLTDGSAPAFVSALVTYRGELTAAGAGVSAWNGASWSSLVNPDGNGINTGLVYALAVFGDDLIAGGMFLLAGTTTVHNIAHWDGTSWSPLGNGPNDGVDLLVNALTLYHGEVIAGGQFTTAGGASAVNIAKWNGTAWSPLAGGVGLNGGDDYVSALAIYNDELIAAGHFATADGVAALNIAKWNGVSWSPLGTGTGAGPSYGRVNAITVYRGELYVTGEFTTAGTSTANYIAKWNGAAWSSLGTGDANGVNRPAMALTVYGGDVVVGGQFTLAGGQVSNAWARWGPIGPFVSADFDQDCDVDADDLARFNACFTGPGLLYDPASLPENCHQTPGPTNHLPADFDDDGDIDQTDFGKLQRCYTGPNTSPALDCLD